MLIDSEIQAAVQDIRHFYKWRDTEYTLRQQYEAHLKHKNHETVYNYFVSEIRELDEAYPKRVKKYMLNAKKILAFVHIHVLNGIQLEMSVVDTSPTQSCVIYHGSLGALLMALEHERYVTYNYRLQPDPNLFSQNDYLERFDAAFGRMEWNLY